jgi:hypothetical protein
MALDLASLPMWTPVLQHDSRPWTLPPCRCGLRCCHMFRGPGPCLLAKVSSDAATCPSTLDLASLLRWALTLPRVPWLRALPPRGGSSGATTCPMAPSGLWTTGIKRGLAALNTQLGSCVSKVRSHVAEAPAGHADKRRHHNQQDVRTDRYSAAQQCSAAQLPTHGHGWRGYDPTG